MAIAYRAVTNDAANARLFNFHSTFIPSGTLSVISSGVEIVFVSVVTSNFSILYFWLSEPVTSVPGFKKFPFSSTILIVVPSGKVIVSPVKSVIVPLPAL